MCGARIGCIVSKNKGANGRCNEICTSKIRHLLKLLVEALDTPQSYFDEVISEYRERRDTLITELHKIEGAKVYSKELLYR
jgi:aspartate aminotransferase